MEGTGLTIILILWSLMSLLTFIQYFEYTKDCKTSDKIMFCFICFIGGPIFVAANILETILNYILPEGWNDDC